MTDDALKGTTTEDRGTCRPVFTRAHDPVASLSLHPNSAASAASACVGWNGSCQACRSSLVSVAKLVDFERGQVSCADFIGIIVLPRG
jgi:hypothetical protein